MLTEREQTRRREITKNELGSQRLEGLEPDEKIITDLEKWARGEVEIADLIVDFSNRVKRGEVRG